MLHLCVILHRWQLTVHCALARLQLWQKDLMLMTMNHHNIAAAEPTAVKTLCVVANTIQHSGSEQQSNQL